MRRLFFQNKRTRLVTTALLAISLSLSIVRPQTSLAADAPANPPAASAPTPELKLEAKSAILMDASTGQILYGFNENQPLPPASMAKMMTEYLVLEAIKNGNLKWDDMVNTSQYAADVIGSGGLLALNEQLTVKQMFSAMSIYSANDASVALAERLGGGSEENFAKMMNDQAKKFGLSDQAHFISATGLTRADLGKYAPKELQGETMLTAKDAALLAYNLIKDHKEILDFTKTPSLKLRDRDKTPMINWNWMIEGNSSNVNFKKYAYPGLDGLKTGHTNEAGYCFTATAERNGMRLISVIMGTATEPKRFEESKKILDYGFNNFETKQVLTAKSEIDSLKTVNIKKGVATQVPVVTQTGITVVAKKGAPADQFKITAAPADESRLVAPITKGQVLGTVKVSYMGTEQTTNLIAAEDVEKGSWIRLFFRAIKNFFMNTISGVKKG
ncbi:D-alanyl-D-alanine carboxypeptidase [Paenibacillus filicis]|uniref:serine-type D-Ala-D-Ala carboxypeptidase n=1 Tax=Paenibacillus gyeongsangnamensis TaxID=3388067 RepID=A0ABT4QLA2_9BACL|nr:D-alanyl-D-alanine carboxypeptidase family protein [Paenibacillus filicis]MCZ8517648.1 D-alanyl-D-alanine carboxypeptidase [Paenibacillus filicis]